VTTGPTPHQAADALRNVDQRTDQARESLRDTPRWLDVVFGVVFLLYGASADFLPGSTTWRSGIFLAIVLTYTLLIRTRRGSALLGQPTRVHRQAISPKFTLVARLTIGVIFVGSLVVMVVLGSTHSTVHVPYLSTILGAVMAVTLIGFGPRLRAGMTNLAGRGHRAGGAADGRR
jgi:hypothetical protein